MSPHQRALTAAALVLKSRRTKSARAAAAGSAMVVLFHRLGVAGADPRGPHQPGDPLRAVPAPGPTQFGLDARRTVTTLRVLVHGHDRLGQVRVILLPLPGAVAAMRVVGGTGDLQQLARSLDVAVLELLRLDEPIHVHRVSFANKAVARRRISRADKRK